MFTRFYEHVRTRLGSADVRSFRAPGRVNLIGEHTDYNDGFVFPAAIDREVRLAIRPRNDCMITIYSVDQDDAATFSLDAVTHDAAHLWSNYLRGVCKVLMDAGYPLRGADIVFSGNVPMGAGLSSSAALEVATATALLALADVRVAGEEIAKLTQLAERSFVGTNCGIMDMFVSALGQAGHALLLDCRSLAYRLVPVPSEAALIITDSGVRRTLVTSAYNERREQCEEGVRVLQQRWPEIRALRDATHEQLMMVQEDLVAPVLQRCRHVVSENARVEAAAEALTAGDLAKVGTLFLASHASLRDDFAVSHPALDTLVEIAMAQPGVFGSRMTGAGFGGCTVTLARADQADAIAAAITDTYGRTTEWTAQSYVCTLAAGAGEVEYAEGWVR